jgi:hypothetical protein
VKSLALPRINLNGNTKQSVLDEVMEIRNRIEYALKAMREVEFTNGRNFQTYPDKTIHQLALSQHQERIEKLEELSREMLTLAFEIQEAL